MNRKKIGYLIIAISLLLMGWWALQNAQIVKTVLMLPFSALIALFLAGLALVLGERLKQRLLQSARKTQSHANEPQDKS